MSSATEPRSGTVRMTAEERRASVVRAAVAEFARGGLHGTSTEAIARRVGVSQPYLFRLFANKKALFLAAGEYCFARIADHMGRAADGATGHTAMHRMAYAYHVLLADDNDLLTMQLHMYAAAAQDPEVREEVRRHWYDLDERCRAVTGADPETMRAFLANGMLCNVISALGLPQERYYEQVAGPAGEGRCPMCAEADGPD